MDIFYIVHVKVGEPQQGHYTCKQLLKMEIYLYNDVYKSVRFFENDHSTFFLGSQITSTRYYN